VACIFEVPGLYLDHRCITLGVSFRGCPWPCEVSGPVTFYSMFLYHWVINGICSWCSIITYEPTSSVTSIAFTDCSEIILRYVIRNKVVQFYNILTWLIVSEAHWVSLKEYRICLGFLIDVQQTVCSHSSLNMERNTNQK